MRTQKKRWPYRTAQSSRTKLFMQQRRSKMIYISNKSLKRALWYILCIKDKTRSLYMCGSLTLHMTRRVCVPHSAHCRNVYIYSIVSICAIRRIIYMRDFYNIYPPSARNPLNFTRYKLLWQNDDGSYIYVVYTQQNVCRLMSANYKITAGTRVCGVAIIARTFIYIISWDDRKSVLYLKKKVRKPRI